MLEPNNLSLSIITDDEKFKKANEKQDKKDIDLLSPCNVTMGKPPRAQSVSPRPDSLEFLSPGARCRTTKRAIRMRSASAGRSPKNDLRARYWAFLFDNLRRAVDEIYQTCEMDESIVECKEAILMLENYSKEFCSLAQWFKLSKELEIIPAPERPSSLSWEVRKSSPGKCMVRSAFMNYILTTPCRKGLNFQTLKNCAHVSAAVQTDDVKNSVVNVPLLTGSASEANVDQITDSDVVMDPSSNNEIAGLETSSVKNEKDLLGTITSPVKETAVLLEDIDNVQSEKTLPKKNADAEDDSLANTSNTVNEAEIIEEKNIEISAEAPTEIVTSKDIKVATNVTTAAINETKETKKIVGCNSTNSVETQEKRETSSAPVRKPLAPHNPIRDRKFVSDGFSATRDKRGPPESAKDRKQEGLSTASKEKRFITKPVSSSAQPSSYRKNANAGSALLGGRRMPYVRPRNTGPEVRKAATTYVPAKPRPELVKSQPSASSYAFRQDSIYKTESVSSVSSSSSGQSWADKVKGSLEVLQSKSLDNLKISAEDDEGWETVHRGRTRGRNSPAKKIQPAASVSNLTELPVSDKKNPSLHSRASEPEKKGPLKAQSELARNPRMGVTVKTAPVIRSKATTVADRVIKKRETEIHSAAAKSKILGRVEQKQQVEELAKNAKNETTFARGKDKNKMIENVPPVIDDATDNFKVAQEELENSRTDKEEKLENSTTEEKEKLEIAGSNKDEKLEILRSDEEEKPYGTIELHDIDTDENTRSDGMLSSTSISSDSDREDDEEMDLFDQELERDWSELLAIEVQEQVHELGLSWGDEMDQLDQELHRTPGRALQVHEKLSSPYKKRSPLETRRRHEQKLAKAQEQRERLLEEKAQKCKNILKKAEEMRAWKEEQQQQKKREMETKLQRAEEKRKMQLQRIVRKAHDEESKVNEIAFINTLEAQNKRHDILSKEKDREARLQDRQKEQLRRQEEKAAKEAAAEERRKVLEAERQARLLEMQEKRKIKDKKIEQQLQEKEKERQELATQKARDREQRLSALNAEQQANREELQKKIQQKQEESARRHEENIESIRQKAFELSVRQCSSNNDEAPLLTPYETKKICTLCNIWISSEVYLLSHLRGKKHQEAIIEQHQGEELPIEELELYNIRHIVDAPSDKIDPEISLDKERQKALKKRCKKIRHRMINKGETYEKIYTEKLTNISLIHKQKFQKGIKDVEKSITALTAGSWESSNLTTLERALGELERVLEKSSPNEKEAFCALGGIFITNQLLKLATNCKPDLVPIKSLVRICHVWQLACENSRSNCGHVMRSNQIIALLDLLVLRLHGLLPPTGHILPLPLDPLAGALMRLLAGVMTGLTSDENDANEADGRQRVLDVISYTVSVGIVDKLSRYLLTVRSSVDSEPRAAEFILQIISFLASLAKLLSNSRQRCIDEGKSLDDGTHLVTTFRVTELVGTVSFLYGALLHSGAQEPPPELPPHTVLLTTAVLRLLNWMAVLDLQMTQGVLAGEGLSLQFRHIASYLLGYCCHWNVPTLLHELIMLIGFFTLLHTDNQAVMQSGQRPTVLQQLCSLPFAYFSDPERMDILFPTLISCCFRNDHNTAILEQELSPELLANYLEGSLLDVYRDTNQPRASKKDSVQEEVRWKLGSRFPKDKWTSAKQYFSV